MKHPDHRDRSWYLLLPLALVLAIGTLGPAPALGEPPMARQAAQESERTPTDQTCRGWIRRWPLPLLEEIHGAPTADGEPVCRGLYKSTVVVEVEASRAPGGWKKGAIRVEGVVAGGREEAYRLAELAMARKGVRGTADLPTSEHWEPLPPGAAQVWLSRRGLLRVGDGRNLPVPIFNAADVGDFAASVRRGDPEVAFELAADRAQPVGRIVEILYALQRAGVELVGLRTQAPPEERGRGRLLSSIGGLRLSLERIDPASAEDSQRPVIEPLPGATLADLVVVLDRLESPRRLGADLAPPTLKLPIEEAPIGPAGSRPPSSPSPPLP